MTSSVPPVVIRGSGNNIIVNPSQVCAHLLVPGNDTTGSEREQGARIHQECRTGIRGHCCRLPSGQDHGSPFSQVTANGATVEIFSRRSSLKYHSLRPDYILTRIEKLGRNYDLRILLVLCDVVRQPRALQSRIDVRIDVSI